MKAIKKLIFILLAASLFSACSNVPVSPTKTPTLSPEEMMQAAQETGIRIPEDVSLLGFDNIRLASLPQIDLTTVAQPKEEMAVRAVKMLIHKIESGASENAFEIIEPKIIERGSCRKISLSEA